MTDAVGVESRLLLGAREGFVFGGEFSLRLRSPQFEDTTALRMVGGAGVSVIGTDDVDIDIGTCFNLDCPESDDSGDEVTYQGGIFVEAGVQLGTGRFRFAPMATLRLFAIPEPELALQLGARLGIDFD